MKREPRRGNSSPFSMRMPAELRTHLTEKSAFRMISEAAYVCALIQADMGKRPRRPSRQHVLLRTELTKIHAAIIALGNQVTSSQIDYRVQAKVITSRIEEIVVAILRLEDKVRGK